MLLGYCVVIEMIEPLETVLWFVVLAGLEKKKGNNDLLPIDEHVPALLLLL